MKKHLCSVFNIGIVCGFSLLFIRPTAAQQVNQAGGILPLAKGTQVISLDAHNELLVQFTNPDDPEDVQYQLMPILHVYSGGIARILGGTIIPTELLVSPAAGKMGGSTLGGNRQTAPTGTNNNFSQPQQNNQNTAGGTVSMRGLRNISNLFGKLDRAPKTVEIK